MATGLLHQGKEGFLCWAGQRLAVEIVALADDTVGVVCDMASVPDSGQTVDLQIRSGEGLFTYHMLVVVGARESGEGLILQRAGSATYMQRRKSLRVPLGVKIAMRRQGADTPGPVTAVDLSSEGMLIEGEEDLALTEMVDLFLPFPGSPGHLIFGKVVRNAPANPPSEKKHRYGLWFVDLSPEARRSLILYIWQRLRELYPGEIAALFPGSRRRKRRQADKAKRNEP